jgi:hypothetical protein
MIQAPLLDGEIRRIIKFYASANIEPALSCLAGECLAADLQYLDLKIGSRMTRAI